MNARFSWAAVLWLAAGVVCLAIAGALAVHSGCVDPGPPVSRPDPGTPRAGYCATMDDPGVRVALIAAAGAVLVALAALTARRRWVTLTGPH